MWFNFFKKKTKEVNFNIYETTYSEESYNYNIKDVQNRKVDAIICRNFISTEECNTITEILLSRVKHNINNQKGIFNEPLTIITSELDGLITNEYKSFVKTFKEVYKVDVIEKIFTFLSKLNNKSPKQLIINGKNYISPVNFRVMVPNSTNLFLHCGNQFNKVFTKNYNFLSTQVEVHNHLSYFIVLKKPEIGGELVMYDIDWKEAQKSVWLTNTIIKLNGEKVNLDKKTSKIKHQKLDLKVGDLLIFAGGEIWHKVEDVKGKEERITFGGFIGFGNSPETTDDLYVWT